MMMKFKQLLLAMSVMAVFVIAPAVIKADPIVMTLNPSSQSGVQGSSVTFQGTFANQGTPARFVNAVGFSFSGGFVLFTFNSDAFFNAVPQVVNPSFTTGVSPVNFFTVLIDPAAAPGVYTGSFSAQGGADAAARGVLATEDFTLIVTAIPEPATIVLLGSGLLGAAAARRRKQRQTPTS